MIVLGVVQGTVPTGIVDVVISSYENTNPSNRSCGVRNSLLLL